MDKRAIDEVVEALRSAVRALRAAERVLTTSPSTPAPTTDAPLETDVDSPVSIDPAEKALLDFLTSAADDAKDAEEHDPQTFRVRFEAMAPKLRDAIIAGDMYQTGPSGSGMTRLDNTPATTAYEACLKAIRTHDLHAPDVVVPHLEEADIKPWGDVDTSTDLVVMRYETQGDIEAHVLPKYLESLMNDAQSVPGAIDRCRTSLMDRGVTWTVRDEATGDISCVLVVSGAHGRWAACVDVGRLGKDIVNRLSVVSVSDSSNPGWWAAAKSARDIPAVVLPVIRGQKTSVVCKREQAAEVEDWASRLPAWYDNAESSPITIRDALSDDILSH